MKPKRDHLYHEEKPSMSLTEARALGMILVWGSFVAMFVLSDHQFSIFLVTAIVAAIATGFIWGSETVPENEYKQNRDAQAALHLLELLEEDEIELLKSRLRAQVTTSNTALSQQENTVIGQQILIR